MTCCCRERCEASPRLSRIIADCDIVMGNGFIIDAQGKRIRRIRAAGFTLDRYFYGGATWLQQATFFRRAAFEAVGGFNVNNRSCWDGELLVDMVRRGAQSQIPQSGPGAFSHPCEIHHRLAAAQRNDEGGRRTHVFSCPRAPMDALDTLRGYLFRIERILTHPGAVESAIRARMSRGCSGFSHAGSG